MRQTSFEDQDETSEKVEEGVSNINWQPSSYGKWALNCDWPNKDLSNAAPIKREDCSNECVKTPDFSEFLRIFPTNFEVD